MFDVFHILPFISTHKHLYLKTVFKGKAERHKSGGDDGGGDGGGDSGGVGVSRAADTRRGHKS